MNSANRPRTLFVTGTDTNVGKTHLTCLIIRQLKGQGRRVAAYKPVCSGAIGWKSGDLRDVNDPELRWDDIERIKSALGDDWPAELICPQRFLAPLAPPVAARLEGRSVIFDQTVNGAAQFGDSELLLVEGAGGWLSPLTETQSVADLAVAMKAPVLIVARAGLGTINHTLLTVEAIQTRHLSVSAIVLNEVIGCTDDQSIQSNAAEIESRCGIPVLGIVRNGQSILRDSKGAPAAVDWCSLGN